MRTLLAILGLVAGGCGSMPVGPAVDASGDVVSAADGGDAATDGAPVDAVPDGPVCPSGRTFCAPGCVDLRSDPGSCGTCYHACASGQTCTGGMCVGAADGGADGGVPVTYDLSTMYPDRVLDARYATYYSSGPMVTPWRTVDTGPMTGCYFQMDASGPHVGFNIRMVNFGDVFESLTGAAFDPSVGGQTSITWQGSDSPVAVAITGVITGPRYTANGHDRMSFHIMFRFIATTTHQGVTGLAGETTFPDQGDAWVLGCPLN